MRQRLIRFGMPVTVMVLVFSMTRSSATGFVVYRVAEPSYMDTRYEFAREMAKAKPLSAAQQQLKYFGGTVQQQPKIYVIYWGDWSKSKDKYNVRKYFSRFVNGLYGPRDNWSRSVEQYCQGIDVGTSDCNEDNDGTTTTSLDTSTTSIDASTVAAPSNSLSFGSISPPAIDHVQEWMHPKPFPKKLTQTAINNELLAAAQHFGNLTPESNEGANYMLMLPRGIKISGFGKSWCAWHSMVYSNIGDLAYTFMPYMPDAGYNCGAYAVNAKKTPTGYSGILDGVSIVGGHEVVETYTDPDASNGWIDENGEENADKCSWYRMKNVAFSTGKFAMQPLWSNSAKSGMGGCVHRYISSSTQSL